MNQMLEKSHSSEVEDLTWQAEDLSEGGEMSSISKGSWVDDDVEIFKQIRTLERVKDI